MLIYRAYKFRMYPSKNQETKLNMCMGTSRFIYNYYLDKKDKLYKEKNITYNLNDMKKDVKTLYLDYPWLKSVDSMVLRTSLDDLDRAYQNFYRCQNNYPKFKKKGYRDSFRTLCIRSSYKGNNYSNIKIDLERKVIKLPKLDEIKIRGYRNLKEFNKKIINATVSKEASKYYVSVCVEEDIPDYEFRLQSVIGIDIGVKNIVVTSDGIKYEAMQNIKRLEKKIKGLNKKLSRCQKGSNNRLKVIDKLRRTYQKIRNIRKYYIHSITSSIVKDNDLIITEDLQVKNMIEDGNKHLRKNIINTSFSEIVRQIEYKTKWLGKKLIKVNSYFPSSQKCSHCGEKNVLVKDLSVREWTCECCSNINDRDINASINILMEGIKKYYKEEYSY